MVLASDDSDQQGQSDSDSSSSSNSEEGHCPSSNDETSIVVLNEKSHVVHPARTTRETASKDHLS